MISAKVTIEDRDREYKRFQREMRKVNGSYVTVGVHLGAGSYPKKGVTVAQVAFWNEFGTERAPARSFIRSTLDQRAAALNVLREVWLQKVFDGKATVGKALEAMGFVVKEWITNKIQSNVPPPNAASTLARKAELGEGSMTLQATRLLLRSIAYKVHE